MTRNGLWIALFAGAAVLMAQDAPQLSEGAKQYREHRFAEAEKSLRADVSAHPDDAEAHAMLGRNLAALKKADEGDGEIRKAQEMGLAEDRVQVAMAAAAIERRDTGKAMELLNKVVEANPESAEAFHYRGMVKTQQKDFQGGVADLEEAVELDPGRAYSHYYLGLAYNGLKRPDKMAEELQTFLKLAPNAPDADKVRSVLKAFR
jgi:tetratricopeptide (TPR) repeat protein